MKNQKNGSKSSQKCVLEQNSEIPTTLKFGSTVLRVLTEMENWCRPLWKIKKMALTPQKCILEQNSQLPTPPKVWACNSPSVDGNGRLVSAIMKNQKNDSYSQKCVHSVKLLNTNPNLKFGSAVLQVLMEMEYWRQPLWKISKMALSSQKCVLEQNSEIPTTLKFGSFAILRVLTEMENCCWPLWKIKKMALTPQKCILEQNYLITDTP